MSSENNLARMQHKRFEAFKAQDPVNFDVTFEGDGKLIYANKYVLESISTTFKSMLSERWKSKDEIIKLETYKYEDFKRFLTFVYSGSCKLSSKNILTMTDIAEFYDAEVFKDFCDEYISKMRYNMDNILDFMELVTKYTLPKSKAAVDAFTVAKFAMIVKSDKFMTLEKASIESLVAFQRGPNQEEALFEAVYKWAENQFISDESPIKQKYVNMNEGMKAELSGILPHIKFNKMNPKFLYGFVVSKGFLFTYEQLSAMINDYNKITITVTNGRKILTGSFIETFNAYDSIKRITAQKFSSTFNWYCIAKPAKPSECKKNEDAEFYMVIGADQKLQIKKPSEIIDADYILCEMKGDLDFTFGNYCELSVSRGCFSS